MSIIGGEIFERYFREEVKLEKSSSLASAANGQRMDVRGECVMRVEMGGVEIEHLFKVINDLGEEIIIGNDLLKRFGIEINFQSENIQFKNGNIVPFFIRKDDSGIEEYKMRAKEDSTIPARSVMYIDGRTDFQGKMGEVFTPLQIYQKRMVYVQGGIVEGGVMKRVRIINVANFPVKIRKGSTIAVIQECEVIRVINETPKVDGGYVELLEQMEKMDLSKDTDLTEGQQKIVRDLLKQNVEIFAKNAKRPGVTSTVKHAIDTNGHQPIKQRPHRLSHAENEISVKEVKEMLANGVIRKSKSAWASPVVLVKKKDGSTRFCIDYRRLNQITKKDVYPLPRIDETIDKMRGMCYFSSIDLASGYWQVEVMEEDKEKTAFICSAGLFEFNVMPFGLCNAPATFQRMMDEVCADLDWRVGSDYIDDVITGSTTFEEHLGDLQKLFDRLKKFDLTVKLNKCSFFKKKLIYLGHEISNKGVRPNPEKIVVIEKMKEPVDLTGLRRFLGLTSYYRRFVKDYAKVAEPLNTLLRKGNVYRWNDRCQKAFQELKERLKRSPILTYPDFSKPFILYTDASMVGLGAVLSQQQDDGEGVIAYASRSLSKAERNYSITELECLAIVWATSQFRPYLYGRKFSIITDHVALKWLMEIKSPSGRLARWSLKLQEHEMDIQHRSGKKHGNADAMSRIDDTGRILKIDIVTNELEKEDIVEIIEKLPLERMNRVFKIANTLTGMKATLTGRLKKESPVSENNDESEWIIKRSNIVEEQQRDSQTKWIWRYLNNGGLPEDEQEANHVMKEASGFQLLDGLLYRTIPTLKMVKRRWGGLRIVIPEKFQKKILRDSHNSVMTGHMGIRRTFERIAEKYYWKGMLQDVKMFIEECLDCAMRKGVMNKKSGEMGTIEAKMPLDIISADVLGPLPQTHKGNKYIIVFTDHFSKWVEIFSMKDQKAETVAELYVKNICCRHGNPKKFLSDRGKNFVGDVMTYVQKKLDIQQLMTAADNHQANGMSERFNKTLVVILSMFVSAHQKDWDELTTFAAHAYNTSVHASTDETPYFLMFGRDPNGMEDIAVEDDLEDNGGISGYKQNLIGTMSRVYDEVKYFQNLVVQKRLRLTEQNRKKTDLKIGDLVWCFNKKVSKGLSRKLKHPWKGPFRVMEFTSPVTVILQDLVSRKKKNPVHVSRLKKFQQPRKPNRNEVQDDIEDNVEAGWEEEKKNVLKRKTQEDTSYEVEKILDKRNVGRKVEYLVRWKKFGSNYDSWVDKKEM
ncbi:MAG: RNase H-like domain-containing protein, partial [Vulcanimicrobiaceae bacterium]